jgi:hypothetical protein
MQQLSLFEDLKPTPPVRSQPVPKTCRGQARLGNLGDDPEILNAYWKVLKNAREWTRAYYELRSAGVFKKYGIGARWMEPIVRLMCKGFLQMRTVYYGSEKPGPDYKGFYYEFATLWGGKNAQEKNDETFDVENNFD